jgi:hypothetical protein
VIRREQVDTPAAQSERRQVPPGTATTSGSPSRGGNDSAAGALIPDRRRSAIVTDIWRFSILSVRSATATTRC